MSKDNQSAIQCSLVIISSILKNKTMLVDYKESYKESYYSTDFKTDNEKFGD